MKDLARLVYRKLGLFKGLLVNSLIHAGIAYGLYKFLMIDVVDVKQAVSIGLVVGYIVRRNEDKILEAQKEVKKEFENVKTDE